jgi:hypothetical protein
MLKYILESGKLNEQKQKQQTGRTVWLQQTVQGLSAESVQAEIKRGEHQGT